MTPNEQKVSTAKGMVPVTDVLLDQMVQVLENGELLQERSSKRSNYLT